MKKILLVSWCILAALVLFNACHNGRANNFSKSNRLVGTTWIANSTTIDTLKDTIFIFTGDIVLKFVDDSTGVMFNDQRIFVNNRIELADKPLRVPFTYSFAKNKGELQLDFGPKPGKKDLRQIVENTFTYNKKENTIATFAPNQKALDIYSEVK